MSMLIVSNATAIQSYALIYSATDALIINTSRALAFIEEESGVMSYD